MFVYTLTTIITASWLVRMISQQKFIFRRTILDIPIGLFLLSQIISTITSIDVHTSIWGYYSRSNGGLLSVISYILLFYAFISNIPKDSVLKLLNAAIISGVLVSIYSIPEHFGLSPSCVLSGCTGSGFRDYRPAKLARRLISYADLPCNIFCSNIKNKTIRYPLYAICCSHVLSLYLHLFKRRHLRTYFRICSILLCTNNY